MHDQSNASSKPCGQATPPPLPPRVEPCVEAVTKTHIVPRPELKVERRTETAKEAAVEKPAKIRTEPLIQLRIEPIPGAPVGDFVPATLSPYKKQAIYWGSAGFITGIIFWHAVGFWDVVHSAIFSGTHIEASRTPNTPPLMATSTPGTFADAIDRAISSAPSEQEPAQITTGAVAPAEATDLNCASFTRDLDTGQVHSRPCSSAERMLPENPNSGRENFAKQAAPETAADSRWLSNGALVAVD